MQRMGSAPWPAKSYWLDTSSPVLSAVGTYTGRNGRIWVPRQILWQATGDVIMQGTGEPQPDEVPIELQPNEPTVLSKTAWMDVLATSTGLPKRDCLRAMTALAEVVTKEVKKTGQVKLPGVVMIEKCTTPAKRVGKIVGVKAKPAKMIVKCYPDAALMKIFQ